MLIYDCLLDTVNDSISYDVCIIGAGIAGLILADQLSEKFNIAIIESGDFSINKRSQELNKIVISGYPVRRNHQSRVRQFGGTCNIWAGRSLILNAIDLQPREWIKDSGWPISQEELHRWYSLLPQRYGLCNFEYFDEDKYNDFDDQLYKSIFSKGEFSNIKACWSKRVPRFGRNSRLFRNLEGNNNITLFKNATVEKLVDVGDLIQKCSILIDKNTTIEILAEKFILCTGGLENARILLSSKDQYHAGIGNLFGNVGRYYMDHPTHVRKNIKLRSKIYNSSVFLKILRSGRIKNGVRFTDSFQRDNNLTNNYIELSPQFPESYEASFSSMVRAAKIIMGRNEASKNKLSFRDIKFGKILDIIYLLSPSEVLPHNLSRLYYQYKKFLNRPINSEALVLSHHLEQTPNRCSRLTLSHERNFLGINNIDLDWRINSIELQTANLLEEKLIHILKDENWIDQSVTHKPVENFNDASHHMGTTRMAFKPENGVVDYNCKIFSLKNLYIAGSSVFPTSGNANPTYTIAALALRLAAHLKGNHEENT